MLFMKLWILDAQREGENESLLTGLRLVILFSNVSINFRSSPNSMSRNVHAYSMDVLFGVLWKCFSELLKLFVVLLVVFNYLIFEFASPSGITFPTALPCWN